MEAGGISGKDGGGMSINNAISKISTDISKHKHSQFDGQEKGKAKKEVTFLIFLFVRVLAAY
jgi:hypothetical protein